MTPPTDTLSPPGTLRSLNRALRTYQWAKNLLLFVPMLMAHRIFEAEIWLDAVLGVLAFSLCASFGYVANDLVDREADREHPTKRHRPFASGALSTAFGLGLAPVLLGVAFGIAWVFLPLSFVLVLTLYLATTLAYSFTLKRRPLVDVLVLAGLYTLRIFAGGAATGIAVSEWLLAFSMFFFLSLALLKRFAEFRKLELDPTASVLGRGYRGDDVPVLRTAGQTAGYLSVLVLVLHIQSPEVTMLYTHPSLLWGVGVLLLYWITRVWLLAGRGEMHDDPVLFAAKDRVSYAVAAITAAVLFIASV